MKKGMAKSKAIKKQRKHGFLARAKSHGGRKVLQRRRTTKRKSLTV